MYGYIDKIDFINTPAEKYWSHGKAQQSKAKEEIKYMIKSSSHIGAEKKDGHYSRFIKDEDGEMRLQGRTESVNGGYLNKLGHVVHLNSFFESLPNGTVLLGELYFPNKPGSRNVTTILGCLEEKALARQKDDENKLHYYIFDVWAYNGKSYLKTPIEERIATLNSLKQLAAESKFVEVANYLEGEELWTELGNILSSGGEGIVMTRKGSHPEPGKRTARKTLKVKKEISQTIDAFFTGNYKKATREFKGKTSLEEYPYWQNIRTGEISTVNKINEFSMGEPWEPVSRLYALGYAGSLEIGVYKDGKVVPIGWISGVSDDVRKGIVEDNENWKFKVIEIGAMEVEHIDGEYSLRHAKVINFRTDKRAEDCEFSQIGEN